MQRWRSGESTRLPQTWAGFNYQTRRHMWVEFVGSLFCTERFSFGFSTFPLSSKTNIWFELICVDCSFQFTVSPISTAALERLDTWSFFPFQGYFVQVTKTLRCGQNVNKRRRCTSIERLDLKRVARNNRRWLMKLSPSNDWHESVLMREETGVPGENPQSQVEMDWNSALLQHLY